MPAPAWRRETATSCSPGPTPMPAPRPRPTPPPLPAPIPPPKPGPTPGPAGRTSGALRALGPVAITDSDAPPPPSRGVALGRCVPPAPPWTNTVSGARAVRGPPPGSLPSPMAGEPPPTIRLRSPLSSATPASRRPAGSPRSSGSGRAAPCPPGCCGSAASCSLGKETPGRTFPRRKPPPGAPPGVSSRGLRPGPAGVPEPAAGGRGRNP